MIQFYCLSVLLNVLTGLIILDSGGAAADADPATVSASEQYRLFGSESFVHDELFRLVLGVLTAFVGVLKFLPFASDDIPLLGDFFPALAGLIGGGCIFISYLTDKRGKAFELPTLFRTVFAEHRRIIGIGCVVVAVVHFLIPQAVLL